MKYEILVPVTYLTIFYASAESQLNPWSLPVVPLNFEQLTTQKHNIDYAKRIQRNIWISFRELPPRENFTKYYQHLEDIFQAAPLWSVHMLDDKDIDSFMGKYYKNSSILWAFNQINSNLRVAASDIWRYCALYAFGGFYIDDDATIRTPLDQVSDMRGVHSVISSKIPQYLLLAD